MFYIEFQFYLRKARPEVLCPGHLLAGLPGDYRPGIPGLRQHPGRPPLVCGLPGRVRYELRWHQAPEHPGVPPDTGVELSITHKTNAGSLNLGFGVIYIRNQSCSETTQ